MLTCQDFILTILLLSQLECDWVNMDRNSYEVIEYFAGAARATTIGSSLGMRGAAME